MTKDTRNALVTDNLSLARSLAQRLFTPSVAHRTTFDDMYQIACLGLINAAELWDANRGVPFVAYARTAICHDLNHYLQTDGIIRFPRARRNKVTGARKYFTRPSILSVKLAHSDGCSKRRLGQITTVCPHAVPIVSLLEDTTSQDNLLSIENKEAASHAWHLVEKLPHKQREAITKRYRDTLPLKVIAAQEGITTATVIDRLNRGLKSVRLQMEKPSHGPTAYVPDDQGSRRTVQHEYAQV